MRAVRAFALGAGASAVLAYTAAAVLAVSVTVAGGTLRLQLGPLVFVAVEHEGRSTVTTFGVGLALVALAGGCLNALVAGIAARRRRPIA